MNDEERSTCHSQGMLLVVSGPAGVGKTTIVRHIRETLAPVFSVSLTTRPKSDQDVEGQDYYFVDRDTFVARRDAGELLEWAEVFGNFYGTPRQPVDAAMKQGKLVVLEIDVQGAIQVKQNMPEAVCVFILPPDEDTLLQRLRDRKRDTEEVIQRRFREAKREIETARTSGVYEHFIVNENLDQAKREAVRVVEEAMNRGRG